MDSNKKNILNIGLYLFALLVGLIAGFTIFDRVLMPTFTRSKGVREIPNVVGIPVEEAERIATQSGFDFVVTRREHSDSIPETFVISQRPDPGTTAKKGRRISVVVSLSVEIVEVPNIAGVHLRQAEIEVDAVGLVVGKTEFAVSDSVEKDKVISTVPPIGAQVDVGDTVNLLVSLGAERALVKVPNFMGQKIDEAYTLAESEGLELIVKYRRIPSMQPKTVYRQSPDPGTTVERGNAIVVIVAQGEE